MHDDAMKVLESIAGRLEARVLSWHDQDDIIRAIHEAIDVKATLVKRIDAAKEELETAAARSYFGDDEGFSKSIREVHRILSLPK
jgi:hypothetical protein